MPMHADAINMSAASLKCLMQELTDTVAIIVDERSMVSAGILGKMEKHSRQAAFNGQNSQTDWGGVPIILLIGDDCQLPSVDEGSFFVLEADQTKTHSATQEHFIQNGLDQFLLLGKNVMQLTSCALGPHQTQNGKCPRCVARKTQTPSACHAKPSSHSPLSLSSTSQRSTPGRDSGQRRPSPW
jgi:hypothetical protein